MSLPDSHTPIPLPDTGDKYAFSPPQEGDVRSVCPALNAMTNRGYMCVVLVVCVDSLKQIYDDFLVPVTVKIWTRWTSLVASRVATAYLDFSCHVMIIVRYLLFAGKAQKG